VIAIVDANGNYFANAVPLQPGANTLTATVTTPSGKSVSASITVTSAGPSPVVITADPLQGPVPLRVGFKFQNPAGFALTSFSFNPGGAGSQVAAGPGEFFAFTYSQAGIYQVSATLFDNAGNSFQQSFVIQGRDPAEMDAMFRAIWNGMNTALVAGDKAKAMTYLSPGAKEKYGPVFDKLMPNMAAIVASYSTLQRASISAYIAEYAINRTISGVNRIFLIGFVQDENGAWVIDSM
jgi:hypothetical protein